MKNRNRLIMGSAIGIATIAVAIDHSRHRLPEPVKSQSMQEGVDYTVNEEGESPCSMDASPCSLNESPCSLD